MKKIEAIAVDIDGTITDSKRRICISAIEAIRKAEKRGIPTIIVTGNLVTYGYATSVLIGASGGVVCENGGVIFKEGLNNDEIQVLSNKKYVEAAHEHVKSKIEGIENIESNDNNYRETEIVYYNLMPKETIVNALEDFEYLDKIEIYDSNFAIHITNKNVNKGSSLKFLCEQCNINIENVMGIGDSENDAEFLEETGLKIAVNNADEDLKNISDYVCKNSFGEGVKEAIEKFVFRG